MTPTPEVAAVLRKAESGRIAVEWIDGLYEIIAVGNGRRVVLSRRDTERAADYRADEIAIALGLLYDPLASKEPHA